MADAVSEGLGRVTPADKGIHVYSTGLVHCSVCAPSDISAEEIVREVNLHSPTGISSAWQLSDESFADNEPNPHPCERASERMHYLMVC